MAIEQTLSIIKPDAVENRCMGKIIAHLQNSQLDVVAAKMLHLSKKEAEEFYAIHKERPFFSELVSFMTQGPVLVMVLEGDNAVQKNRDVMGATDPKKAESGTIRALYGKGIEANAIHGSDSKENAKTEIAYFFSDRDIFSKRK